MLSNIVKRITADWYGDVVPDVNLQGLISHLEFLSGLTLEKAVELWTVKDPHGRTQVNREAWYADQKILKIAAGFFANKQTFLPLKAGTLFNRIEKGSPYRLIYLDGTERATKIAVEWLDEIKSTALAFLKGIKKWQKASDKEGDDHVIQHEFVLGPYKVFNNGGYPAKIINPLLKYLEEANSKISPKLQYGDVYLTTSKELRGNNTLAFYVPSRDTISLLADKAKVGHPVQSIVHEFGHRLWYKFMTSAQKQEVAEIFRGSAPVKITQDEAMSFMRVASLSGDVSTVPMIRYLAEKNPDIIPAANVKAKDVYDFFTKITRHTIELAKKYDVAHPDEEQVRRLLSMTLFINYNWSKDPFMRAMEVISRAQGESFIKWFNKINNTELFEHVLTIPMLSNLVNDFGSNEKHLYPSEYSKTNVEEFFAENYRAFCLGQPMSETMQNLLKGY